MFYRDLHQTIETITSKFFAAEIEMLVAVVQELVKQQDIQILGGRIWQFSVEKHGYEIMYQTAKKSKISDDFILSISDTPLFDNLERERTVLRVETNDFLKKKGIARYYASGVGNKIRLNGKKYYEYLIAFNSPNTSSEYKYSLNIIATVVTAKLKQWRSSKSERSLKADIDKARVLQKSILPQHEYPFFDYDLYGITYPAEIVGGDFFDYLEIGDDKDRLGIVLGDAASKGIAASAEAMYISGAIRMAMTFEIKIVTLMRRINTLVNKIFSDDKFSSFFYGELSNDKSGLFLYSNAGHNPPFFYKRKEKKIYYLNPTGPVLGPAPKANYTVESIMFEKGDILLIYSDGMIDSADKKFESFGEKNIEKILLENVNRSSKEIAALLIEAVVKYSDGGEYNDDKTVVVIKKKEN